MRKGLAVNLKGLTKVYCATDIVLPHSRCFLCNNISEPGETLCLACLDDLSLNSAACPVCAKPSASSKICADCLGRRQPFINNTWTLFQYHYPVDRLVQHMKFKQGIYIANYLGKILGERLSNNITAAPDCIIPVPLHPRRLISRGYNQSLELARPLSKILGAKLDTTSCERVRATIPQTGLSAKKRKKNVLRAFSVTTTISYDRVLVVDDVITTGSTVNELARMLQRAGVGRVDVLACARAA